MKSKRRLYIAAVFILSIFFLAYISRQIYFLSLPKVYVDFSRSGIIKKESKGEGVVDFNTKRTAISNTNGIIELHVKRNDRVKQGDLMYTITTPVVSLNKEISAEELNLDSLITSLGRLERDYEYYTITLELKRNEFLEETEVLDTTGYDWEISDAQVNLRRIEVELERVRSLYDSGVVAENEYKNKVSEYDAAIERHSRSIIRREQAVRDYDETVRKQSAAAEEAIRGLEKNIGDIEHQRNEYERDIDRTRQQLEELRGYLTNPAETVYAEQDCMILDIASGLSSGGYVSERQAVLSYGIIEDGYVANLYFENHIDYVNLSDILPLSTKYSNLGYDANINSIEYRNANTIINASFISDELIIGQTVATTVRYISRNYDCVVPVSAINYDRGNCRILHIEKESFLGIDYYIVKELGVEILEQDINNAALEPFNISGKLIVINSNEIINTGDSVNIFGGGDIDGLR